MKHGAARARARACVPCVRATLCRKHLDKANKRNRAYAVRKVTQGLCIKCLATAVEGMRLCTEHHEAERLRHKRYRTYEKNALLFGLVKFR